MQGQSTALYSYDSRNFRVKRVADGQTVYATYDQAGRLIAESDDQGRILYEYVYAGSELLSMFSYVQEGEGGALVFTEPVLYYYITDHLGTPQMVVDATGQVVWQGDYLPFGEVQLAVNQVGNSIRFPGQYFDGETGLHYNWNRYYDPTTGRYISADPIGLDGGINLFAYVGGDPVNAIDFQGLILILPNDPTGLPSCWIYDPTDSDPNGTLWRHPSGAELKSDVTHSEVFAAHQKLNEWLSDRAWSSEQSDSSLS